MEWVKKLIGKLLGDRKRDLAFFKNPNLEKVSEFGVISNKGKYVPYWESEVGELWHPKTVDCIQYICYDLQGTMFQIRFADFLKLCKAAKIELVYD